MKNCMIIAVSMIMSVLLLVGVFLAAGAGFLYMGAMAWEKGWARGDSLKGPDGYTYCIMHETGIGQDPKTKLIRTKDLHDEDTYEELGQVNEASSWLPVIRPSGLSGQKHDHLFLTSQDILFTISYTNHVSMIYDVRNHPFYGGYLNNEVSPFILLDEKSDLSEPDIFWVINLIVDDDQRAYIPNWPKPEMLKDGLAHPNAEVRKLSKWFLEIREKGFSRESDTISELIAYLSAHLDTADHDSRNYIQKSLSSMGVELPQDERLKKRVQE